MPNDKEELIKCEECGKMFDPKYLAQVMAHMTHKPVSIPVDIVGERVK